jgi:hypothetical protein
MNPGELATSLELARGSRAIEVEPGLRDERVEPVEANPPSPRSAATKGNRRWRSRVNQQSYDPIVPVKVGNPRAPGRGGQGTHWREGVNRWTE